MIIAENWEVWLRELVKDYAQQNGITKKEAVQRLLKRLKKMQ